MQPYSYPPYADRDDTLAELEDAVIVTWYDLLTTPGLSFRDVLAAPSEGTYVAPQHSEARH